MLEGLAPALPFHRRLGATNLWLFGPLVQRRLAAQPATDAALRTTIAATVIAGGDRDNVLPRRARAVVNLRVHPATRPRPPWPGCARWSPILW